MPEPTHEESGPGSRQFTESLLEMADFLGMDEEASAMRADLSQVECARRVLRICQLAGLPVSVDGGPGIEIAAVRSADPATQAFLGTGVSVRWHVGPELDRASENAKPGEESDLLFQVIVAGMDTMLATVLEQGGCRTTRDSLHGPLVVRVVTGPESTDPLYLAPSKANSGKAEQ
jgi:hypothetical protein